MPGSLNASFATPVYDGGQVNSYTDYRTENEYEYDPGVLVLPVAGARASTVTVRVHAGYGTRTVKFRAGKTGNPPVLPKPVDTARDRLVGTSVTIPLPQINGTNSGYDWVVFGTHKYVTFDTPRIPGTHELPAGGRPAPVQPQDYVAGQSLQGIKGNDDQSATEVLADQIASADLNAGNYIWPFTIMPAPWFSDKLVV